MLTFQQLLIYTKNELMRWNSTWRNNNKIETEYDGEEKDNIYNPLYRS